MTNNNDREQLLQRIAELEASEQYFRTLYEATIDAVLLLDEERGIFDCNRASVQMFHADSKEEICSLQPLDLSAPRQAGEIPAQQLIEQYMAEAFEEGHKQCEWLARRLDGQVFAAHITMVAIKLHNKPVLQCIVRDISELKQREAEAYQARKAVEHSNRELQVAMEQLQLAATTDQLTAAWNRRFFNQVITTERARAARSGNPLTLILIDIDHFKKINDTYGHLMGDYVLREVAETLHQALRLSDYLIRWGGEEFAILAPDLDEAQAEKLAERLRHDVQSKTFSSADIRVTISAGVAQQHEDDILTKWVSRADNALYAAKNNGRNQVVVERVA